MAKKTILAVDDEPTILELVGTTSSGRVRREDVHLGRGGDPGGGKDRTGLHHPRLMLPGIDGLDVCRRLKQRERTRGLLFSCSRRKARTPTS
jgi:CheY-like chemotaxis protein